VSDDISMAGLSPEQKRSLLARLLEEKVEQASVFPLSHGQRALWVLYRLAPASPAYNVAFTARLRPSVEVPHLAKAYADLVQRHESLRITIEERAGVPVQRVARRVVAALEEIDAIAWSPDRLLEDLERSLRRPFDLEKGPVVRASLYHGRDGQVLLLAAHHIAVDAWSIGVLVSEWLALYDRARGAVAAPLAPLPASYADFVQWQESLLAGREGEEMLGYWRQRLRKPLPTIQLPTDKPRPSVASFRGRTCTFRIDEAVTTGLRELAHREGTTLFASLLSAFFVLLHRYSGQDDILVGCPTAGRSRGEFEGLVGYFVNPAVVRGDLSGRPTFVEFLGRVRQAVVEVLKNADYPFPLLVQQLNPERDPSRSPLFQVEFNLIKAQQLGLASLSASSNAISSTVSGGLTVDTLAISQQEGQFDLTFEVVDLGASLLANVKYSTDLFEAATIERMGRHLQTLLRGILSQPTARISALPILTAAERETMAGWNATARDYPLVRRLHELVEEQVARTPDSVAVQAEGERLTYGTLNARANQLGRYLRRLGAGPEVRIGVAMERSLEMVVALLGILKAGGAYVPLDPTYPRDRLSFMIGDARVPVLLTQRHLLAGLPESRAKLLALDTDWSVVAEESAEPLEAVGRSENLAYVIYTSGSTGQPKGAMNTHRGIVNRLLWMQEQYGIGADDVVIQKTPFSFDVSVWEFFWPLLAGARLVMARPEGHKDPSYLVRTIVDQGVTTIHFVPAMLQAFLEEPGVKSCTSLRRVICSGEALPAELCSLFFERLGCELHNLYGPTEAAVDVTNFHCRPDERRPSIPIGRPVANTRVYVLGPDVEPVPVGVAGELHLGGVQVGRGYLGRPDLTAERFIPDPFTEEAGARLYGTGDLARLLPDGNVEYLGRLDNQVKIRGFRIELGEIEAAIRSQPTVREAVVLAREDRPGDRRLVAYIVTTGAVPAVEQDLRVRLRAELPEYMVPSVIVPLDALPLSPNGKVDRKSLPAPDEGARPTGLEYVAPRTGLEKTVSDVWASVLGKATVGVEDNFFDLGGNSILLLQVVAHARKAGIEVTPLDMFRFPTVRALAAHLTGGTSGAPDYDRVRDRAQRQREAMTRKGRTPRRV